jgi:hypothetical protein
MIDQEKVSYLKINRTNKMEELSFTEIEQVNGAGDVKAGIYGWVVSKILDYAWDNRAAIVSAYQAASPSFAPIYAVSPQYYGNIYA